MLTKEEASGLAVLVRDVKDGWTIGGFTKDEMLAALKRATDGFETNDVIAKGPDLSSQHMLNMAARALGWRTDFATGDSPITWELVLEEIHKLKAKPSFTPEEAKWLAQVVLEKASPDKDNPYKRILFKILPP